MTRIRSSTNLNLVLTMAVVEVAAIETGEEVVITIDIEEKEVIGKEMRGSRKTMWIMMILREMCKTQKRTGKLCPTMTCSEEQLKLG